MKPNSTDRPEEDIMDIIIFGATGYVGKFAIEYVLSRYGPQSSTPLKIGFAARSIAKLTSVFEDIHSKLFSENVPKFDTKDVKLLEANLEDYGSLLKMTHQAYCVIALAGPYTPQGEKLIEACIETRTHYCDITGEYEWVRDIQMKYGGHAAKRDVKIVHFCGFESVPIDLANTLVQQHALEKYKIGCRELRTRITKLKGAVSTGTFASLIGIIKDSSLTNMNDPYFFCRGDDGQVCGSVQPSTLQTDSWNGSCGLNLKYEPDVGFTLPHVTENLGLKVTNWSHMILSHCEESLLPKAGSFKASERLCTKKGAFYSLVLAVLRLFIASPCFFLLYIIAKTPLLGTWVQSFISRSFSGPIVSAGSKAGFGAYVLGTTYPDAEGDSHNISCKVTIEGDPAYVMTAAMAVESGVCLSQDFEMCPSTAGSLTPAAAMSNALVARLQKSGIVKFQMQTDMPI